MLKFYYGTMGSAKTTLLLTTNHSLRESGNKTLLLSPHIDTRREKQKIKSRVGIEHNCTDFSAEDDLYALCYEDASYILVDEAQFLTTEQVEQLRRLSLECVSVFCFGLKTDFKNNFFEGSKRLLEIADEIIEVPHFCGCGARSTVNARFVDGVVVSDGPQVLIGDLSGEIKYKGMCYKCWDSRVKFGSAQKEWELQLKKWATY